MKVKVTDTPGYNDNRGRELRVASEISSALTDGAHLVLYVIDGATTRLKYEDSKSLQDVIDILGANSLENIYIFVTRFEKLKDPSIEVKNWQSE